MAGRVTIVAFDHHGQEWYCLTDGRTLFEAVRNGMRFFADDYWRGPKPGAGAIFTVAVVGNQRTWRVKRGSVQIAQRRAAVSGLARELKLRPPSWPSWIRISFGLKLPLKRSVACDRLRLGREPARQPTHIGRRASHA